jgi:Tol biopolymer transport system component
VRRITALRQRARTDLVIRIISQEDTGMQLSLHSRHARIITLTFCLVGLLTTSAAAQIRTNGRIAYSHQDPGVGSYQIFTMNPDGTGKVQLTNTMGGIGNFSPDWSSTVDKIVFVSTRDGGNGELYVMNPDGSQQTRLTNNHVTDGTPAWSPDGSKIVFVSTPDDGQLRHNGIYIVNSDGSGYMPLTDFSTSQHSPVWSPDGTKILFSRGSGFSVMNADGSGLTPIPNTENCADMSWSPDGDKLVFASSRDGLYEIYTMNANGTGTATRLTYDALETREPVWSPDGTKIVFVKVSNHGATSEIYVMDAAQGGNEKRLTGNTFIDASPSWHPVSRSLVISEFRTFGPERDCDEFVEIYNPSDSSLIVHALDGSGGFSVARSNNNVLFTILDNTVIPPRGHYLAASHPVYCGPSSGGTSPDATLQENIHPNDGIALFQTANQEHFTLANRLDAAGTSAEPNPLYREGTGYPPLTPLAGVDHSLYRDLRSGFPQDSDNNEADFVLVNNLNAAMCTSTANFQCRRLGAPGLSNLASPVQRNNAFKGSLIDAQCSSIAVNPSLPSACRFERRTSAGGAGAGASPATFGTLSIRRRFTNNTGAQVTTLRFRIVDLTTTPEAINGNPAVADLRAITSSSVTATCQNESGTPHLCTDNASPTTTIAGTTLETNVNGQPNGGAFNSTLAAGTITTTPLASGASINIQFLLGVERNGSFRFFINIEALPVAPNASTAAGNANLKSGGIKAAGGAKQH